MRPLGLIDRVRLGVAVLWLRRRTDWEQMDGVPAVEWLERVCGPHAVEAVWSPLLLGKFGADAGRVPLAWFWSKLVLRRRLRGSTLGEERLGYPRGSFRAICVALAKDTCRTAVRCTSIARCCTWALATGRTSSSARNQARTGAGSRAP